MELKFDEKGLIPAIVQDHYTKEVLTLAYMNAETLALTIAEKRTVFWSRSRQEIWRKGESSGNVQRVVSITADCDGDALVVEVVKAGPACHTGEESCFHKPVYLSEQLKQFSWQALYQLIEVQRADALGKGTEAAADVEARTEELRQALTVLLAERPCVTLRDMAVNGRDLMAEGIAHGRQLGETLNWLLAEVLNERLPNEREALLSAARTHRDAQQE